MTTFRKVLEGEPQFVTFTGIDDQTDPERVGALSDKYAVEWGILFSRANTGIARRYPKFETAQKFFNSGNRLSAHICGSWAVQIADQGCANMKLLDFLMEEVERTQINVRDGETNARLADIMTVTNNVRMFGELIGAVPIMQSHSTEVIPTISEVFWLVDASGGAGISPETWPSPQANVRMVGYAGGLGPHNIVTELPKIRAAAAGSPYWIDMETHVRNEAGWLDLDKCEAVLQAIYPW